MLDVFKSDAFGVIALTDAINKAPFKPGRIGAKGLFRERGIATLTVSIEERDGQLQLIQSKPRGGVPETLGAAKRKLRAIKIPHIPFDSKILADEIQGVRAFGSEDNTQVIQTVVNERLAEMRASHEVTLEHLRVGALQGLIKDADGSTLYDLFDEFDVVQQTAVLTPNDTTDEGDSLRGEVTAAQRLVEAELGATPIDGYEAVCGKDFFDDLRADLGVVQTLRYADPQSLLRQEANARMFSFAGVEWEEYRGSTGGTPFVADAEAYLYPRGADIFRTYFGPADFVETVNTLGLPVYAKQAIDEFQRHIKIHTQSNPLALCLRPRAVIKLTMGT